jgi:hypothetical protein
MLFLDRIEFVGQYILWLRTGPTWKEKKAITRMNTIQAWIFNRVSRSDSNEGKHERLGKVEG